MHQKNSCRFFDSIHAIQQSKQHTGKDQSPGKKVAWHKTTEKIVPFIDKTSTKRDETLPEADQVARMFSH